jgi:hypothetical protein
MEGTVRLTIEGLGIVLYSPLAAAHIARGDDYLKSHFWKPEDVARHVNDCEISAFSTGGPGRFVLRLYDGQIDSAGVEASSVQARLGVQVHEGLLCFRDLYDLLDWEPSCPEAQTLSVPSGFYRITAYTSPPSSGILGDDQAVWLHLEPSAEKPRLAWSGVPDLVAR